MTDNRRDPTELWYRASAKNVVIFALTWLGEAFLILMFVKWVIHGSAIVYLLMIPWTLVGLIVVVRPNWLMRLSQRMSRASDKFLEQAGELFEKRPPPGFP